MAALSAGAIAAIIAASAAGGGLSSLGSSLGGGDEAKAYKKAAAEQLRQQIMMAQWGWGYPEWMTELFKSGALKGGKYADELQDLYNKAAPLYNKGFGENPLKDPTDEYVASLTGMTGNDEIMSNISRLNWNNGIRGLEGIPGMGGRAVTSATRELTNSMQTAIQQAIFQGRSEKMDNLEKILAAKTGLAQSDIQLMLRDLEQKQKYAEIGFSLPGQKQALEQTPLIQAAGLPNRSPSVPWPGMDAPSGTSTLMKMLGATLTGGAMGAGMAYGGGGFASLFGGGGNNVAPTPNPPATQPAPQVTGSWADEARRLYGGQTTATPYTPYIPYTYTKA
jgi:hypothetical protein